MSWRDTLNTPLDGLQSNRDAAPTTFFCGCDEELGKKLKGTGNLRSGCNFGMIVYSCVEGAGIGWKGGLSFGKSGCLRGSSSYSPLGKRQ
jgi:hypothetical protein